MEDFRSRWMLPIFALVGGVIVLFSSIAGPRINLPVLAASAAVTLLGATALTDRIAARIVSDPDKRQRLNDQAKLASNGLLVALAAIFAIYEASDAIGHLKPATVVQGRVVGLETHRGSKGTRYVDLILAGQTSWSEWRCKYDCGAYDSLRGLRDRDVRLTTLGKEILGVEVGEATLVDADASRTGDLEYSATFGLLAALGGGAIVVQTIRQRRTTATAAGTVR